MGFSQEVVAKLQQPLDPSAVSKRSGGGSKMLSYLSGYYVDRTLIEVFGYGNVSTHVVQHPFEIRPGLVQAVVRTEIYGLDQDGSRVLVCSLEDVGYGTHNVVDTVKDGRVEMKSVQEIEKAGKEAVTDARKRTLVTLGDRFGLVLYDKDAPIHNASGGSSPQARSSTSSPTSTSTSTSRPASAGRTPISPADYPPSNDGNGGWTCDLCSTPIRDSKSGWKAGELATMSARANAGQIRCFPCKDK